MCINREVGDKLDPYKTVKTLFQKKIFQLHFLQFINAYHIFSQILLDGGTTSGWFWNCLITYCHLPLNLTTYHLFFLLALLSLYERIVFVFCFIFQTKMDGFWFGDGARGVASLLLDCPWSPFWYRRIFMLYVI